MVIVLYNIVLHHIVRYQRKRKSRDGGPDVC